MNPPRFSVIIPSYNAAPLVVQAVESVLAQTHAAHEILVIDDGSTDDTAACLEPYQDRIRYLHQSNAGVAAARNRGLAEATGDWIAFLDADDVWHPSKLARQARVIAEHPQVGLLATLCYDWPAAGHPELPSGSDHKIAIVPFESLVVRNQIVTSSVVARREVIDQVGGFDPRMQGPEDYDLWLRVAERTPVLLLETPLVGYRDQPVSLSKNAERMEQGMRLILDKLDERGHLRNRPWLRRKTRGYFQYTFGYLHYCIENYQKAVRSMMMSFWFYPLPYERAHVRYTFGRARLLVAALRKMLWG